MCIYMVAREVKRRKEEEGDKDGEPGKQRAQERLKIW